MQMNEPNTLLSLPALSLPWRFPACRDRLAVGSVELLQRGAGWETKLVP